MATDENFDRTLTVEIPPSYWDVDPSNGDLSYPVPAAVIGGYSGGWTIDGNAARYETTIDLSGYERQDLTFFPYASFLQEGGFWIYTNGAGCYTLDVLSSIPIDYDTLYGLMVGQCSPGFIPLSFSPTYPINTQNPDTVMHSQFRTQSRNIQFPGNFFLDTELEAFGSSLEPTAADKLYFYRVVILLQDADPSPGDPSATPPIPPGEPYGTDLLIPAGRLKIPGKMMKEPDLEYMMRLKRSYELANQK